MDQEPCTVNELRNMSFDKYVHPRLFFDRALAIEVNSWVELDVQLVKWLTREGSLRLENLPIRSASARDRYFVNSERKHGGVYKADWRQVGEFWVDTKFNAQAHINNLLSALQQLGVNDPHFYVAFRMDNR